MNDKPFSLMANLVKTPNIEEASADGKLDFTRAMTQLGYTSVFDILRTAKPAFVRQLYTLSNADGEQAYENARCYATQIVRLYRNQLISSGRSQPTPARSGVRSLVEIGPSFPNLFKENWDRFCKVGALEAKDSPVAYLTSLYRFALQELEGSTNASAHVPLELRRPDLKDLLLNQQSTFTPIPMLNLVHDVLGKAIRAYVDTVDADKDKSLYQLIAEKQHPFLFPYNFYHQQIVLGLSGKKPMLGELSYRASLQMPTTSTEDSYYGEVQQPSRTAQIMMSGLSPQQQMLMLESGPPSTGDDPNNDRYAFFKQKFDINYADDANNPLQHLRVFSEKTGLNADQVESLLAIRKYAGYPSANVQSAGDAQYDARYVNGPSTTAPMDIVLADDGQASLSNTSVDRFDRLQRMIRLQRWTGIAFAELDTLIMAVIAAEGTANTDARLTDNSLRALGCYRYLQQHHGLQAEEFAGLLHDLSPCASNGRLPMFDQVFNDPVLFDTPLVLDGAAFALDDDSAKTLAQLAAGLHLSSSEDGLWPLAADTLKFAGPLKRDLPTVSSLYRQARVASLFGLAARDSQALIDLLGAERWREQLATGQLSAHTDSPDSTANADVLDVLMNLDWAATWLKAGSRDISTLRRLLGVDPGTTAITQALLDQLNQLSRDARQATLHAEQLATLNLPNDSNGQPIDWWPLLQPLIDAEGLVIARPLTLIEDLEGDLTAAITDRLKDIQFASEAIRAATVEQLLTFVLRGYLVQHRLVESLLQSNAGLALDRSEGVLRWAGSSADQFLNVLLKATADGELILPPTPTTQPLLDLLERLLRHAEACQQLGLSAQALRTFLVHPAWLGGSLNAPLPLSLHSLHLLERYRDWCDKAGQPEDALLGYFIQANATPPMPAPDCAALLAPLLDWSATEINAATPLLPEGIAQTIAQVDWLRRLHSASQLTRLGSASLLQATDLNPTSQTADWQAVGDAVMAASRQ